MTQTSLNVKIISAILVLFMICPVFLTSCVLSEKTETETKEETYEPPVYLDDFEVTVLQTDSCYKVSMNRLPVYVSDLENVDITNEYISAAVIVAIFCYYEFDPDATFAMIDYMMGPENLKSVDKVFINEQFRQYPYVARSYLDGAVPENDYNVYDLTFSVYETSHTREEEGYVKLFFQSGGADSLRGITLRQKRSTEQWFLFADSFKNILTGIRYPVYEDDWN